MCSLDTDYDILLSSNAVIILAETQTAELHLNITDDSIVEGMEQITLALTDIEVVGIEPSTVNTEGIETRVLIQDDDGESICIVSLKSRVATHQLVN